MTRNDLRMLVWASAFAGCYAESTWNNGEWQQQEALGRAKGAVREFDALSDADIPLSSQT